VAAFLAAALTDNTPGRGIVAGPGYQQVTALRAIGVLSFHGSYIPQVHVIQFFFGRLEHPDKRTGGSTLNIHFVMREIPGNV